MKLISNTSPLILLFEANLEFVLRELYGEIIIPEEVLSEILISPKVDKLSNQIESCDWIKKVKIEMEASVLNWDLGKGESAVLSYALQNPNSLSLLDDRLGKKCAGILGIDVIGTGGLLVFAKRQGIIKEIRTPLEKLKRAGLWITNDIIQLILHRAGE